MEKLRKFVPVFFSRKFWGVVLTALALWLQNYGFVWSAEALSAFLVVVAAGATGVGVLDSAARKVGWKK